jgi:DNA-binding beta-propeller fold protein YncE
VIDDLQQTVSKFSSSGVFEWRLDPQSDPDLVGYYHGGGVDQAGDVWLTNDGNGLVLAFDADGNKLETWDTSAAAPGLDMLHPCRVVLDAAGNAYVFDCETPVLAVFDPEHRLIANWTMEPGSVPFGFNYRFGPDGRLYALAGGDRAAHGTVDQPDTILVMDVALPAAE